MRVPSISFGTVLSLSGLGSYLCSIVGISAKVETADYLASSTQALEPSTLHTASTSAALDMQLTNADLRSSQLRVIHLIKHCGYANGSVHVAVDLACVQASAGYNVTVISSGGTFVPLLEQYGVVHHTMAHEQGKPLSMLWTAWRVGRLARKDKAHALHAHMMSSAMVGYLASRLAGVPLITTVHNSFDKHSFLMRLGDRVVAVSQAEREHLLRKGYNCNKLVAVMNAPGRSPRHAYMNHEQPLEVVSPCIVAANGLHRRKGVFDLIEAVASVFAEYPAWKLYIAGEGPDREELGRQVREAGIEDRVHFLGLLAAPRVLMEKADIFVLASYAEPCSLGVGEARSAGCAIIATDVGGTPEMLDFGRAGILIQPGKPVQLAGALRRLMGDDNARAALQRAALEGSEIFDVQRLVLDYERVYLHASKPAVQQTRLQG